MTKKLKQFSTRNSPSRDELKKFRRYVSLLKKQGKIPKSIDARSVPATKLKRQSLANIVNKNLVELTRSETTKTKLLPLHKPISLRDFPLKHSSLAAALSDLDKNYKVIDAMKRPGEKFAFQIDGIRSYAIFSDIRLLTEYLKESAGIQHVMRKRGQSKELFSKLKLVRWNKTASEWKPKPQTMKKKSHSEKQAKSRARKKK